VLGAAGVQCRGFGTLESKHGALETGRCKKCATMFDAESGQDDGVIVRCRTSARSGRLPRPSGWPPGCAGSDPGIPDKIDSMSLKIGVTASAGRCPSATTSRSTVSRTP